MAEQLETWPEKQSRQMAWRSPHRVAILVDKPQLITLIQNLEKLLPRSSPRPRGRAIGAIMPRSPSYQLDILLAVSIAAKSTALRSGFNR